MPDAALPLVAPDDEPLSRFAWSEDHFDDDGDPTWRLFKPQKNKEREDKRRETSVSRVSRLSDSEIWELGHRIKGDQLIGRADFAAGAIPAADLRLDCDPPPNERHAAIVDWPEGETKLDQEERRAAQKALARTATGHFVPSGG